MAKTSPKRERRGFRIRMHPLLKKWLSELEEDASPDAPDWEAWYGSLKKGGRIVDVGGVLVDRAVIEQRFACIPERCSPKARAGGRSRCCCADLEVDLSRLERRHLDRFARPIAERLASCEERLGLAGGEPKGFWYEEESSTILRRPAGRCVFSTEEADGRVRCHLRGLADELRIERSELQPLTCRIFPLLLVDLGRGRLVLSVLARHTHKEVGSLHPRRFPCLSSPGLPSLLETMGPEMDWMFGAGFVDELVAKSGIPELR